MKRPPRRVLHVLALLTVLALLPRLAAAAVGDPIFSEGFEKGGCRWSAQTGYTSCVGVYDFSCAGDTPPATAVDPLAVSGTLTTLVNNTAISGATIEARRRSNDSVLDSDTTVADGSFALSAATAAIPLEAYLAITATNYPATYFFPPDPLTSDVAGLGLRAISSTELSLFYTLIVGGQVAGTGTGAALVTDCFASPVAGATVAFAPPGTAVRYLQGGVPSASATSTDDTGFAIGPNLAAGSSTVSALLNATSFESHSLTIYAGGVSVTVIHP